MYAPSREILCHPLQTLSSIPHAASARMNLLPRAKRNTIDRIGIEISILRLLQRRKTALCRKVRSRILSRHLADAFVLRDGLRFAYKIGKHRSKLSGWIDDTGLHMR